MGHRPALHADKMGSSVISTPPNLLALSIHRNQGKKKAEEASEHGVAAKEEALEAQLLEREPGQGGRAPEGLQPRRH